MHRPWCGVISTTSGGWCIRTTRYPPVPSNCWCTPRSKETTLRWFCQADFRGSARRQGPHHRHRRASRLPEVREQRLSNYRQRELHARTGGQRHHRDPAQPEFNLEDRGRPGAALRRERRPLPSAARCAGDGIYSQPDRNTANGRRRNPLLEPYKANQFDLSYEWYFHDESMFAAALYYKDLKTLIGAGQETADHRRRAVHHHVGRKWSRRRHQGTGAHLPDALPFPAGIPAGLWHVRQLRRTWTPT